MPDDDGEAGHRRFVRWVRGRTLRDWVFGAAVATVIVIWGVGQVHAFRFQLHLFR